MTGFNDKLDLAMLTGEYICSKCGAKMYFVDEENEDTLMCSVCGNEDNLEHYGYTEEEYNQLYLSYEDVFGGYNEEIDEYNGEWYEEECDELSHDD